MRKRNCRVDLYFTKAELEVLTQKVRKAGLSREGFCRRTLNGVEVKEALHTLHSLWRQSACGASWMVVRATMGISPSKQWWWLPIVIRGIITITL